MNKIITIQNMLGTSIGNTYIVQPHRYLIKEGPLLQEAADDTLDYSCYMYLFNDAFLLAQKKQGWTTFQDFYLVFKELVEFQHVASVSVISEKVWDSFGFLVTLAEKKRKPIKFFAKTMEDRQTWVDAIQKSLDKFHEKQSSFKASSIDTPAPSLTGSNISASIIASLVRPVKSMKSPQSTHATLKRLIELLKEALKLESEIFAFPIELETLIPQYYRHLNANYVSEYDARIQALMQKLTEIENVHATIRDLIAQDQNGYKLHRIIVDGHGDIERLKDWVLQQFPPQHPQYVGATDAVSPVMQWYINLTEAWDCLLGNSAQT